MLNACLQKLLAYERLYIDFFEEVVALNMLPGTTPPKIVVTSLLLSELINAYMRQIALRAYANGDRIDFKREYRPTPHYRQQLRSIASYATCIVFRDDDFLKTSPLDLLNELV